MARRPKSTDTYSLLFRLRVKCIVLIMVIVGVALTIAFATVCYIDYQQSVNAVYDELSENMTLASEPGFDNMKGNFFYKFRGDIEGEEDAETEADADNEEIDEGPGNFNVPQIGGRNWESEQTFPQAIYSVDASGNILYVSSLTSASIATDVLEEAVTSAIESGSSEGYLSDVSLFYVLRTTNTGYLIAFADRSAASSWQTLAFTLVITGIVTLLALFLVSIFFSRWALRPVSVAWKQQQQFIADASHELKTPLTVILANNSIIRSQPTSTIASQSQWLESTQTEAENMQALVSDMLDLAQPEKVRSSSMNMEDVEFGDLVEGEVLTFESVAFEGGITMDSDIASPVEIHGDRDRLRRLVDTLLENACKYAGVGGKIDVSLTEEDNIAYFKVTNSGEPISKEDLPHVFDRFFRTDKARTRSDGMQKTGWGLGLAIAKDIAEDHGGSLSVESDEQEGTTFTFAVPAIKERHKNI
ncbi:MAG: HAMP domain-containing histidine kinase [Eggerthellaceae bacterium]|nr:HAMP domain-containing histidine kinase [Eggerthellaceae bacterium]